MRKLFARRPSGAMIVAIGALVFAMVGTGIAAQALTKSEKKQVKKISRNQFGTQFAARVMAATIPQGDACTISNQTGGITAVKTGQDGVTEACDVTFPKSVAACEVGATPMHPLQDVGGQASTRPLGGAVVRVTRVNDNGTFRDAGLFTIFAICQS
jgi:hypothetical protein